MLILRRAALAALLPLLVALVGCSGSQPAARTEAAAPPPPAQAPAKIAVKSLDDLPVHTYPLEGSVSAMFADPAAMQKLEQAYKADLESDLATYDITDEATLQGKYGALALCDLLEGRDQEALAWFDKVRDLEDKDAARQMNALISRALFAAKAQVGAGADQADPGSGLRAGADRPRGRPGLERGAGRRQGRQGPRRVPVRQPDHRHDRLAAGPGGRRHGRALQRPGRPAPGHALRHRHGAAAESRRGPGLRRGHRAEQVARSRTSGRRGT